MASTSSVPPASANPSTAAIKRLARRAFGETRAATGNIGQLTRGERLEVHAGAEVSARTGEDRHRQLGGVVQFVHGIGEPLHHRKVERVTRFRTIDRDDERPTPTLPQNYFRHQIAPSLAKPDNPEKPTIGITVQSRHPAGQARATHRRATVEGTHGRATGKVDSDKTPRHARIGAVQVAADGKFTCD